jgi:hypothetical protein
MSNVLDEARHCCCFCSSAANAGVSASSRDPPRAAPSSSPLSPPRGRPPFQTFEIGRP